jgi:hypothetical protein
MRVAVDYDNTISAHPEAWFKVIEVLKSFGADVVCITSRFPNVPLPQLPIPVYYTCGQPKWEFANEKGIPVDIWVDDIPTCIGGPPMVGEPGQAPIRRQMMRQFIDANFNTGPY